MKISKQMTEHFTNEMRDVAKQIKGTENIEEKLFYFSAVFGAAQRIVNFEFDDEKMLSHRVEIVDTFAVPEEQGTEPDPTQNTESNRN